MALFYRREHRQLTKNFWSYEFYCKCNVCSDQLISLDMVDRLQEIRNYIGRPIEITSGYRCLRHNKSIGGAARSYHLHGTAADWRVKGFTGEQLAEIAEKFFNGIGVAETWIHTDTRMEQTRWHYPRAK